MVRSHNSQKNRLLRALRFVTAVDRIVPIVPVQELEHFAAVCGLTLLGEIKTNAAKIVVATRFTGIKGNVRATPNDIAPQLLIAEDFNLRLGRRHNALRWPGRGHLLRHGEAGSRTPDWACARVPVTD